MHSLDTCSIRKWVTEGRGRWGAREAVSKFLLEAVNASSQALGLQEQLVDVKKFHGHYPGEIRLRSRNLDDPQKLHLTTTMTRKTT
jgi:hypothetical protein